MKFRSPFPLWLALWLALAFVISPVQAQRQMEKLGRGIIALRSSSTQVYVGWRLLGNDPEDIAFNVYRSANGAAAVKLNGTPITATTDYLDTPGSTNLGNTAYTYSIRPVIGNVEVADIWANPLSGPATLPAAAPTRQYFSVPIQPTPDGALKVGFCWVGDLDGDGEYDYVIARHNQNVADSREFLEGYKRDGTFLWRLDMGPNSTNHYNIEPGSSTIGNGHGDNVTVYDMDGDGKAEAIVRTANGVVFGNGVTLTAANNDTQFISIVNGLTGAEMARATVPNPYLSDGPLNGHMGILYSDGLRPSVVLAGKNRRADNGFQGLATAWDYRGGVITQRWSYDSETLGEHAPEAHQIRLGDPDNDGKDDFIDIGYAIDENGLQLFNIPEVVHGDRFHMSDIDPDRPGLETYLIQQDNGTGLATAMIDSGTGQFLKKWYAAGVVDVGRGLAADIDPAYKGLEMFSTQGGIFNCKGVQIYNDRPFAPEAIWWDGNLSREFLATVGASAESPAIARFDSNNPSAQSRIYTIYNEDGGCYWGYGARPPHTSDIFGDWREEIVVVANDNSHLRIYSTKNVAANRIYTPMHNAQYRIQATTKGYVQSSYVDYYLGDGMTPPQPPPMVDAKLVWRGGTGTTTWDNGTTQSWRNDGVNSTYTAGDTVRFDLAGNAATTVNLTGTLSPGAVTIYSPTNYTFGGSGNLAGSMKLTKAGAGTASLPGTHTFTGRTTVWDGGLYVNGDLTQSPITVWGGTWGGSLAKGATGGRIGGTGRFSQPVTLKYRGAVTPGSGMNNAGTVTLGSGLTAEDGSTLALDLSNSPVGTNDRIAITGNLTLAGTVGLVINPLNTSLGVGTYTLVTYTGTLTGSAANFAVSVPPGTPYTLAAGSGAITLTVPVTRAPAAITWRGTGSAWDIAASQNWLRSGTPDVFVSGDTVTFDATGAAQPVITLNTAVPVAGMTVNAAVNYTFNGTGSIAGTGGLTKSGTGTLSLNTNNDYTGPTTVNGGVLAIDNLANGGSASSIGASGSGAGNLVLNGGTLRLTGSQTSTNRSLTLGSSGGTLDIPSGGSSIQISGTLLGSGSLTKSGSGTILLASTNTYTGGTFLNGGTIYLAGANANVNALGSGSVTINNGTLTMADVQASETAAWNLVVPAGATARLNVDGRCSLTGTLTGGGNFTVYTGFIRTDFKGNWSAFTGQLNFIADGDGGDFRITNTNGYANASLDLGADVFAYYNTTSSSPTIDIGALSGVATAQLGGTPTGGRTVTWRIGGKNTSTTFAGPITNGVGPAAVTKVGTGTLTLSGASTYTGATTVSAGTLALLGSTSGSAITVASGATLHLTGTITGNVTVQAGGTLTGSGTITGNLSNAGLVSLTSGTLAVNGTITNTGTVRLTGGAIIASTGVFTNSGILDRIASTQPPPANLVNTGTILVNRAPAAITWTGATNGAWDLLTTVNWQSATQADVFFAGDTVTFNDTATNRTVTLSGTLAPAAVNVSTANTYTVSGGTLGGFATLTKTGAGTLNLSSATTYSGGTVVSGGTLALSGGASLGGSTSIEVQGGATLNVSGLSGGLVIGAAQTLRSAGAITGNVTVNGLHQPGTASTASGSLGYGAASRLATEFFSNATTSGSVDTVTAGAVTISAGAALDLVFNSAGSTVDFSNAFWATARTWTVLTGSSRTGTFTLGNVSADLGGRSASTYGSFSLQQSGANVAVVWTPKQNQTITFGALSGRTYDDAPFAVSATASSGLSVVFSIVSGPATISGSTVTITGAGTVTVRAAQAGNAAYFAAPNVDQSFTVAKAAATVTLGNLNATYDGTPKAVSVVTAPAGLGTSVTYDGSATAPSAVGSYDVAAAIDEANYQGAASGTLTINKIAQTITFGALAGKTYGNAPFAVSATASSGLAVTFSIVSGPATVSANTVTLTGAGTVVVRAAQAGNANYLAAPNVDQSFVVAKAAATVTLASLSATYDGTPQAATATTTPAGLTVGFTYNGSATAPSAVGSYTVIGTINDANYQGSATGTLVVGQASQTITFGALAGKTYGNAPFTVSATASSGLAVTFSIVSGPATISGNTVTLTGAGTVVVRAAQAGNANYLAAPNVDQSFAVAKAAATVTLANLSAAYDGTPKAATATTTPAGLTVDLTYNGSATAPSAVGSYTVVGTIDESDYQGSATGTLVIGGGSTAVWTNATTGSALSWSASGNWSGGTVPASAATTKVQFFTGQTLAAGTITSTHDLASPLTLNIFSLEGSGPASGAAIVNIGGNGLALAVNGSTNPVLSLNATAGTGLTYNISTPMAFNVPLTAQGAGTAAFLLNGALSGTGSLTKTGASVLTLGGTNTYSGGTFINGGTLALATDAANTGALGSGAVTFGDGGTLAMYDNQAGDNTAAWNLVAPPGVNATLLADSRVTLSGSLTGGGTLNLRLPYSRTHIIGDWSAFTGTINVTTDADGGAFRYGTSYTYPGFPNAALVLPASVSVQYIGTVNSGAGTVIPIGDLAGAATSSLQGGPTGGRTVTYRIGGRNTSATFAGTITEQTPGSTITAIVKTGAGTWTLGGAASHAGVTTVEQGTLRLVGSLTGAGAVTVNSGAILQAAGGSIAGNVTVNGTHQSHTSGTISGSLAYGATGRLSTEFFANATTAGAFDAVTAGAVTITAGAALDLVFNGPGSTVDFSNAFWTAARTWTVLTGASRTGAFTLGTVSADPGGRAASSYGSFALTQTGATVVVAWTPKTAQTITFGALANKLTTSPPFTVSATASSGLAVSFSIVSGPATISGSTVTLTGAVGTVTVRAAQAGNATYSAAPNVDRSFTVTAGGGNLRSAAPNAFTADSGPAGATSEGAAALTISPVDPAAETVTLTVASELGRGYALQVSETLAPNSWTTVETRAGDGTVLTFTGEIGTVRPRFFRIMITP